MNKKQSKLSPILPLWHETSSKVSDIYKLPAIFPHQTLQDERTYRTEKH